LQRDRQQPSARLTPFPPLAIGTARQTSFSPMCPNTRPAPSARSRATVCRKDTLCKVQLPVPLTWRGSRSATVRHKRTHNRKMKVTARPAPSPGHGATRTFEGHHRLLLRFVPATAPGTMDRIAAELHRLLHNGGIRGPYVVVGHSFGGEIVRVYAGQYPTEVAGLVVIASARRPAHSHARIVRGTCR